MVSRFKARKRKKPRYFYSYISAMQDLDISRRTLQRWIDDMNIHPLEFEDHMRVFITLPDLNLLKIYKTFMRTRDNNLISAFRQAERSGDPKAMNRVKKWLAERNAEKS